MNTIKRIIEKFKHSNPSFFNNRGLTSMYSYNKKLELFEETKDVILSKNYRLDYQNGNNMNTITISSVGTGKTRGLVKSNLLEKGCSFVVTDVKGDLVEDFTSWFEEEQTDGIHTMPSYKVKRFDLNTPNKSLHYNPFIYIHSEEDVTMFVDTIYANTKSNDTFWINSGKALIEGCIYIMFNTKPKESWNIKTFLEIFNLYTKYPHKLEEYCDKVDETDMGRKRLLKVLSAEDADRTWACIVSEASVTLKPLEYPKLLELTSYDELELEQIGNERTAFFIVLDDLNSCYDFVAGLLYTQMFAVLGKVAKNSPHFRLPEHTRFIMDDFANYIIPNISQTISVARSRNISLELILQSESQLYANYGKLAENIINNCVYVYIGGNDINTEQHIAQRLGVTLPEVQNSVDNVYIFFPEGKSVVDEKMKYDMYHRHTNALNICINNSRDKEEIVTNTTAISETDFWDDDYISSHKVDNRGIKFEAELVEKLLKDKLELRKSMYDSEEEAIFYNILLRTIDTNRYSIEIHTSLREIFDTHSVEAISVKHMWKLINMHIDFLIRDRVRNIICGIEIDGTQHNDEVQATNDAIKDSFFKLCGIPVLRYTASDVRDSSDDIELDLRKQFEHTATIHTHDFVSINSDEYNWLTDIATNEKDFTESDIAENTKFEKSNHPKDDTHTCITDKDDEDDCLFFDVEEKPVKDELETVIENNQIVYYNNLNKIKDIAKKNLGNYRQYMFEIMVHNSKLKNTDIKDINKIYCEANCCNYDKDKLDDCDYIEKIVNETDDMLNNIILTKVVDTKEDAIKIKNFISLFLLSENNRFKTKARTFDLLKGKKNTTLNILFCICKGLYNPELPNREYTDEYVFSLVRKVV